MSPACDSCLTRSWLLARLAGHLERVRPRIASLLELADEELIAAVAGEDHTVVAAELEHLDAERLRERSAAARLETLCRCDARYPHRLRELASAPAVLHVADSLERFEAMVAEDAVAIVGSRRATPYGMEVAQSLARGLAAAGVTVVSGMALGIDSAAHAGALAASGPTVAVLPGGAERAYPASKRALHARIRASGAAVSELPPGAGVWRWTFPARNRIIAALAAMTVVVEAPRRSGALLTARVARAIGRPVGAVPGRVTSPQSSGTNALLTTGAHVIRSPQDALDALFGAGARTATADARPELGAELRALLAAIGDGRDTAGALVRAGLAPEDGLAALAALELAGYVRREPGGRFSVVP